MRAPILLLALAAATGADELARPRHNGSYVRDDVAAVSSLVAEARKAAEAGDALAAADRLQALVLTDERGLVAVRERLLYVSPRRWGAIQLVRGTPPFGDDILAAWRQIHDATASAAIRGAVLSADEEEVLDLVERYPASTAVPGALVALSDRALQRGDPDAAEGYLLRVGDHLARGEEALLRSDAFRRRASHLAGLSPRRPPGWTTPGGDPSRSRNGDPLPEALRLVWQSPILESTPQSLMAREADRTPETSPLLPFPPVCDADHVYVHLGPAVAAYERESGKLSFLAPEEATDDEEASGLRELAVDELLARNPGGRAATVFDGVLYFDRALFLHEQPLPSNELRAFDVRARRTLWTCELTGDGKSADRPVFFRGAPAVVGDRLYVCGAVRDEGDDGPTAKEEAHAFCLDRRTGKVIWRRFLGYGDTEAAPEFPPYSGLAPAVAKGVVVAVTGLGVAAALDARSGDLLWLFRYDRKPSRERERLAEFGRPQMVHLRSGWMREPPRIVGDSVYFAPFDSDEVFACWLRGATTPIGYEVEQWALDRAKGHRHSLLEYV
ncbi:MAG: PQQ-binding-like beta-propeller repeat protein, partial [Planctomycetes bacterium]|nr:PQQ-binding-like beta-propeller repeat protein [Planctomycetota bacterium]